MAFANGWLRWIVVSVFTSIQIETASWCHALNSDADISKANQKSTASQIAYYRFNGNLDSSIGKSDVTKTTGKIRFTQGLDQQALQIDATDAPKFVAIDDAKLNLDFKKDFSFQFWIRTTAGSDKKFVVLSQKKFPDNSLASQKQTGWAFGVSNGTWAWNLGSGRRRLTYQRDNGKHMPINDGRWHQLAMSYDQKKSLVRLYYDGINWVTYNVRDTTGFDFSNKHPLVIGWNGTQNKSQDFLPAIVQGRRELQQLVDEFNLLGLPELADDELMSVVIDPRRLATKKLQELKNSDKEIPQSFSREKLTPVANLARRLMKNPYTVHQSADFMKVAPLLKIYRLKNGKITIHSQSAHRYTQLERLDQPEFEIDELSVWQRAISSDDVLQHYRRHFKPTVASFVDNQKRLCAAAFNIHHGGKHETVEEDGWDSRQAIVQLIKRENIDIVMMQETYSSGDFIAAELGYYFATTVDWDYLNQGSNISVISRYPIQDVVVPPSSPFMNVTAKIKLSKTQDIYAMSNWYGMRNFPKVFEFHQSRFGGSDKIPILFAGDFNAVPHTDGGNSPASRALLGAGFADAFRQQYPDSKKHPGPTHRGGHRIDQLYYKGSGLKHKSTSVLSTWPSKFPSDHYLIKTEFELNYKTRDNK